MEKKRAFSGSVRPYDGYRLSLLDLQTDPSQYRGAVGVGKAEVSGLDRRGDEGGGYRSRVGS